VIVKLPSRVPAGSAIVSFPLALRTSGQPYYWLFCRDSTLSTLRAAYLAWMGGSGSATFRRFKLGSCDLTGIDRSKMSIIKIEIMSLYNESPAPSIALGLYVQKCSYSSDKKQSG
jgi:hypothetical protein